MRIISLLVLLLCLLRHSLANEPRKAGPDWWSLQPVRRSAPPVVNDREWCATPIDAFVLAKLDDKGLRSAPVAERAALLRRVTFDLTGLPPTPAEIDAFITDASPDAWEKVVDRLLASPAYGERWGRHWLDIVRFCESQGFERDKPRDHAWRYRDYVIRSFNADKPYPQFIREQLAGDVIEPVTPDGIIATGFLVCGPWDEVGATQQGALMRKRAREEELEDMVSATAQTFLGLTVNCARCHNHKFDPILQSDYYRLKAALEGVRPGDRALLTPAQVKARDVAASRLRADISALEREIADLEEQGRARVLTPEKKPQAGLPLPIARWSFDADVRDSVGELHGTLEGGAVIRNGRLILDGKKALVRTASLKRPLTTKTLEAWVSMPTLDQRGGGVMSVQTNDGRVFDAIVFGERQPRKWIAGSSAFHRTRDLDAPVETANPSQFVHVAVTYDASNRITVYRNGERYAESYVPSGPDGTLRTYAAGSSQILFGLRHNGAGNGMLTGEIDEARLYDHSLSADEARASFRAGPRQVPLEKVLAALSPVQRERHAAASAALEKKRNAVRDLPQPALAYCANPSAAEPTFVYHRGDVEKPRDRVSASGMSAIKTPSADWGLSPDAPDGERRRKLADWLASLDNPLPPRVMVNRIWHHHFGRGLVATPSDFGFNGGNPTHPELLDWLAAEFTASGGSVKHLHRLILLSNTYRQSSRHDAKAAALDADNTLLWRFAPRRLEGEAVRDAMLAVSGRLHRTGGPSFRPFIVKVFNSTFYELTDFDELEFNRRTVYRMNVNSAKSPFLDAFDCPDPSVKAPLRSTTTTPLQALGLMNNAFVQRQARYFAARIEIERDPTAQVNLAYRLALGRSPTRDETELAGKLVREHGATNLCWVLFNSSEFLYLP